MALNTESGFTLGRVTVLPQRSDVAPGLTSWNGHLYLAWTGTDLHLNLTRSADGQRFDDSRRLEQRSYARLKSSLPLPPALTASSSGLHLAWTGGDRRLNVMDLTAVPNSSTTGHRVLPEWTMYGPCLSSGHRTVELSWLGDDGHLHIAHAQDGGFTAPTRLPATTAIWSGLGKIWSGHGICTVRDRVVMAWKPPGRRRRTPFTLAFLHGGTMTDPVEVRVRSRSGPALTATGDSAVMTWTGGHRHIYAMAFSPTHGPGPAVQLPARTTDRAVTAVHDGNLILAWPDLRKRLNVAPLQPT